MQDSVPRLPEALVRAMEHWETRRNAASDQAAAGRTALAFTITISREVGARGTSVAREIGRRLGWPVYDHELLEVIAKEMDVRVHLLESIDEKHVNWLEERMEQFAAVPYVSENAYVRHLVQTVLSLGAHGECVIVGRGAAQILPPPTTLRVRLLAALEDRIATMQELGVPKQEAERQVKTVDTERVRFIKDHFHRDPTDPLQYDLVLNSSRLPVSGCADVVIQALHSMQTRGAEGNERASIALATP